MATIRVLVVDDSVVVRRLVSDTLMFDTDITVVGTAANGQIALQRIAQYKPDLVTLDVEMPVMDGLETLKAIRAVDKTLPVIMVSTLTERGAAIALDALDLGATDYVTKPRATQSIEESITRLREDLLPKVKSLARRPAMPPPGAHGADPHGYAPGSFRQPAAALVFPAVPPASRIDIVAVGVSTGGPNALGELMPQLRADLPVPVVIVQHMPPMFTRLLAERLDARCPLRVREAAGGETLGPGEVLVAPGGSHLLVERRGDQIVSALGTGAPENSCRPAVDVLFRSVADIYGPHALAVLLTGMGQDGLRGCEAIRARGGRVLAQDEATSVVWGMPGFVAKAGLAEKVLPLPEISDEINRLVMETRAAGRRFYRPAESESAWVRP